MFSINKPSTLVVKCYYAITFNCISVNVLFLNLNRTPPYKHIVFIVFLVLVSFCFQLFTSTVYSTPSLSSINQKVQIFYNDIIIMLYSELHEVFPSSQPIRCDYKISCLMIPYISIGTRISTKL